MKELFTWPFWVGLLFGYFLLARLVTFARGKLGV